MEEIPGTILGGDVQFSFLSYFFKKITLSRRDEPCSKSVSQ